MSSPLFQEVREKRGLAYAIHAFHWSFADAGLFGFYAGCAGKDAGELMRGLARRLGEGAQRLDEAAVARAKAQIKVATLSVLEQPGARAQQLARQLLAYGRVLTLEETIARIERIDAAAVRRAGAAMLASAPTVAAIGRIGKVWPAEKVARRLAAALREADVAVPPDEDAGGRAAAARRRALSASGGRRRLSRLGAVARRKPRVPHALGADLAGGRSHPRRLPAPPAPADRGDGARRILRLPHLRFRKPTRCSAASRSAASGAASRRRRRSAIGWASATPARAA